MVWERDIWRVGKREGNKGYNRKYWKGKLWFTLQNYPSWIVWERDIWRVGKREGTKGAIEKHEWFIDNVK